MPVAEPVALVTGANRGIGREVAMQLLDGGYEVILGVRDPEGVDAELAGRDGAVPRALDVSDPNSVSELGSWMRSRYDGLDALVNNAGVHYDTSQSPGDPDFAIVEEALAVNVVGAWRVTVALLPLLGPGARIVNVSSGAGSFTETSGAGTPAYSVSKAALDMLTVKLAADLAGREIKVNAVCPGWVDTDMGGSGGRPVSEGASGIVWAATLDADGPTGGFFRDRQPIPW